MWWPFGNTSWMVWDDNLRFNRAIVQFPLSNHYLLVKFMYCKAIPHVYFWWKSLFWYIGFKSNKVNTKHPSDYKWLSKKIFKEENRLFPFTVIPSLAIITTFQSCQVKNCFLSISYDVFVWVLSCLKAQNQNLSFVTFC